MHSVREKFALLAKRFQKPGNAPVFSAPGERARPRLGKKQKILLLDTLGSLVTSGIPLVQSLKLAYFQSDRPNAKAFVAHVKNEMESGKRLAAIAAGLPETFSAFDVAMFEMGDATGKIGQVFQTLAKKEEDALELERKILGALTYPIAIVVVSILMVTILMIYVIPRIRGIYAEAHVNLPALTRGVIALSDFMTGNAALLAACIALFILAVSLCMRNPDIRYAIDRKILAVPVFGRLMKERSLVIFANFLSVLLASGITVHRAISITGTAMSNTYYRREILALENEIKNGRKLSEALGGDYVEKRIRGDAIGPDERAEWERKLQCFSMELGTAVKVGEQTGSLANMLAKAAERYEREIDSTVQSLSRLLEPLVIIVIGSIVGVVVLAIMMPFFNMVQVVG